MQKLFWLFLLLVLSPAKQIQDSYYFPMFFQIPNIGIAHYGTPRNHENLDKLGAYWWYGNNAFVRVSEQKRAIPLVREFNFDIVSQTLDHEYDQFMLVGNEGEGRGQDDMSPREMANFILSVREYYPLAHLVCLNSYDINYMIAVIRLLPETTCQAYGVHVTHLLQNERLSEWLDRLCIKCEIWITEIGWCNTSPVVFDELYRLIIEARKDNKRVRMIFGYTATHGEPDCTNFIDNNGRLNVNGQAFKTAVEVYNP